jgi:Na+-translocating ferredoxin:NAD+ oxidoreductase RNF subunit RnfB
MILMIVIPVLILGLLGVAFAALLAGSNKAFAVQVNPKLEAVLASLPNSNCGACGFAGCLGYAEAVVGLKAGVSGCLVGGSAAAARVAEIMGTAVETREAEVAFVACQGGRSRTREKYEYEGVADCQAAAVLFGGGKACAWGCLGMGSCERVCAFDAIHVNADGVAVVDREKCTGCTKCVKSCPHELISMVVKSQQVLVACLNHDRGKRAKEVCDVACTACKICEKNCPYDAIHVIDNLAVIDFAKCTQCNICVEKCPQSTIINNARAAANAAGAAATEAVAAGAQRE